MDTMIGKGRKKSKKQQMDLEKWVKKPQKKAKKSRNNQVSSLTSSKQPVIPIKIKKIMRFTS